MAMIYAGTPEFKSLYGNAANVYDANGNAVWGVKGCDQSTGETTLIVDDDSELGYKEIQAVYPAPLRIVPCGHPDYVTAPNRLPVYRPKELPTE
jgi:hypothetical protein